MERFQVRLTAGAIIEREGKILVVRLRHKRNDSLVITQPSGHVEEGESVFEAAVREVHEETGYTIKLTELVGIYHQKFNDHASIRVSFTGQLKNQEPDGSQEKDIETLWLTPDEIKKQRDQYRPGATTATFDDYFAGKRFPLDAVSFIKHTL